MSRFIIVFLHYVIILKGIEKFLLNWKILQQKIGELT